MTKSVMVSVDLLISIKEQLTDLISRLPPPRAKPQAERRADAIAGYPDHKVERRVAQRRVLNNLNVGAYDRGGDRRSAPNAAGTGG